MSEYVSSMSEYVSSMSEYVSSMSEYVSFFSISFLPVELLNFWDKSFKISNCLSEIRRFSSKLNFGLTMYPSFPY